MSDETLAQCQGVHLGYQELPVLTGVDLAVTRRTVLAILGGSGSGKSTLLKAMAGLLPPLQGTVRLFEHDLYAAGHDERARLLRRTGTLFQRDALFESLTILDNVMLPLRELTRLPQPVMVEMARMKLAMVELSGLEHRLPSDISGGQRKRAALARATVLDPEIIFCDEPTTGLDPMVSVGLNRSLLRFRDVLGMSIVAVTHDIPSVHELAGRVVMLSRGRICAEGSVDELERSDDPFVYAFFHRVPKQNSRVVPGEHVP
jgi:phospholipid/cholesterol/gamma-HCH transport system ATP-binding protein